MSATYGTLTIYNKAYAGQITIVNNTFTNNTVSGNKNGKTNVGGSGIYVYTSKTGKVNIVNNTIIGNSTEGHTADGNTSDLMGGALYMRQGTTLLANNVIAGNMSLSGYGDIYKIDAAVVDSKEYSFYTSYDNMNITPERNDIIAGIDRTEGMSKMTHIFDCTYTNDAVIANLSFNGGFNNTVAVTGADIDFDGLNIKSVPAKNLSEEYLDVDLDNDGDKTGILSKDQRGALRDNTGNAYIGAYEDDGITSGINRVETGNTIKPYIHDNHIILPDNGIAHFYIYTVTGQPICSGTCEKAIDMSSINHGIYIVCISLNGQQYIVKFAG